MVFHQKLQIINKKCQYSLTVKTSGCHLEDEVSTTSTGLIFAILKNFLYNIYRKCEKTLVGIV